MRISSPHNSIEFDRYYQFRWEILRAPWQQPKGSEQDEFESIAYHIMAINEYEQVIGVGRLHSLDDVTAQIRYMAVSPQERLRGIGSQILLALEEQAATENYRRLILNARDSALEFYLRHGYEVIAKGQTLYGSISHTRLQKIIR